jgi:hypothetical protein
MNQTGKSDLLDTTDCLEAVGVFRGWKNCLFVVMAICLILLQASFWLVKTGRIRAGECTEILKAPVDANVVEGTPAADANEGAKVTTKEPQSAAKYGGFGVTFECLAWTVRFANAILMLAATLYCLAMLFSLKLSLIGRLGGMSHISRAFFWSLVMLILVMPWQVVFDCVIRGAIFTPCELVAWCGKEGGGIFQTILFYLRFSGYWLLIVLLLILSQLRSARWTKAILRRLEVI